MNIDISEWLPPESVVATFATQFSSTIANPRGFRARIIGFKRLVNRKTFLQPSSDGSFDPNLDRLPSSGWDQFDGEGSCLGSSGELSYSTDVDPWDGDFIDVSVQKRLVDVGLGSVLDYFDEDNPTSSVSPGGCQSSQQISLCHSFFQRGFYASAIQGPHADL